MGRAVSLVITYLRVGIANELQYRVNFFIQVLQSFIALATGLIGLSLVFDHTTQLNGWSRPELLVVMGIHVLMGGLIQSFIQPNMNRLMGEVQEGTFDFALTKPADAQLLVSVREFHLWSLSDVVVGLVVLCLGIIAIQTKMSLTQIMAFMAAMLMGAVMIYCFWLMLTATVFWFIRVHNMVNLFQGLYAAGRWPISLYPNWLRYALTFLVPLAFAITIPAEALTGRLNMSLILGEAGLTIILLILSRLVWRVGVRNYSGASA